MSKEFTTPIFYRNQSNNKIYLFLKVDKISDIIEWVHTLGLMPDGSKPYLIDNSTYNDIVVLTLYSEEDRVCFKLRFGI